MDSATQLVSELVTNAQIHGEPPVELTLELFAAQPSVATCCGPWLQIEVRDAAEAMPVRKAGGPEGGFGLTIATELAKLSFHPEPNGKAVRALLRLTAQDAARVAPLRAVPAPARAPERAPASPLIESSGGKAYVDLIEIDALRLRCVIGCRDEERRDRSDVVIDLRIGTDARPAAASDTLADGWDYRATTKAIIAHVEGSAYRTVEALATAVARIIVVDYAAPYALVRIRKPGALRFADCVGVMIERTSADFVGSAPHTPGGEPS